jgi:penicillin-binding protein 2
MHKWAAALGLADRSGIDLPHEIEPIMPSTAWKRAKTGEKWYAGETISVAIGQGALTVTPLQLAHAIGGLAMGGAWYRPHLVKDPNRVDPPRVGKIDPNNAGKIVYGMYGVVNEGGTGVRARLPNVSVCGKTGSAQLASNQSGLNLKDNAWFVAFAPCESPEIVVSALWEGAEHGYLAGPTTRDVIKAYFDKKARTQTPALVARFGLVTPSEASRPGAAAGVP